jgi:DnaJ-class molecular chaperone
MLSDYHPFVILLSLSLFQILSDEEKRSLYDRFGEEGLNGDYVHGDTGMHGVHVLFIT